MIPRTIKFTAFCREVLELKLTKGQRVVSLVVFDGLEPRQLRGADRELARQIFGEDVDEIPPMARRVLALLLGRGSGKTTLCAAYAIYVMVTAALDGAGPGDIPTVVTIGPGRQNAKLSVRMGLALVKGSPSLRRLLVSESRDGFTLRRADGRLVAFAAFAASRGGASARGLSILCIILDEAQFFLSDGDFVVNDRDIFSALIPRLMKGGKAIFISTPWPVPTLMAELHEKNLGAPTTALAATAGTLVMRDNDPELAAMIEMERERDPENTARESDCDTTAFSGSNLFFDLDALKASVDPARAIIVPVAPGCRVADGADFAFQRDCSANVVAAHDGKRIHVVHIEELRPRRGAPLVTKTVVDRFATIALEYGAHEVVADGHYRQSVSEHLAPHGLRLVDAPGGKEGKSRVYLVAKQRMNAGELVLPNHVRLVSQLRSVTQRPADGGGFTVTSPRRSGGHGDVASAAVLAIWKASSMARTGPKSGGGGSFTPGTDCYDRSAGYESVGRERYRGNY